MTRLPWLLVCVALAAGADSPTISYRNFRYTSFGVAAPENDKKLVDEFKNRVTEKRRAAEVAKASMIDPTGAERDQRIAVLDAELSQPPKNQTRVEELRREARVRELARLKQSRSKDNTAQPNAVVVLVDTLPEGVDVRDGRLRSVDTNTEIIGHFSVRTSRREQETAVITELQTLAEVVKGNVVVLSFVHQDEPQGECLGASGIVMRVLSFDPKKVSRGRLPDEI